VAARLSASASPCTWSAFRLPTASGNSQDSSRPPKPNTFCIAASWPGSAKIAPTQYGIDPGISDGALASGSCVQKAESAPLSATIAVTTSVTVPAAWVASVRRLPGRSPYRAAVCALAATATVPAGSAGAV
jgi:hypothetical protein